MVKGSFSRGGVASWGNPLSESDASKIIQDEARKGGVNFRSVKATVTDVPLAGISLSGGRAPGRDGHLTVDLDGFDLTRRIAYEYVSDRDVGRWATKGRDGSTAWGWDMHEGAGLLRKALVKRHPAGTYAVFYDPVVDGTNCTTHPTGTSKERNSSGRR